MSVEEAVLAVREEWGIESGEGVNRGECREFAYAVLERVEDGASARLMTTRDLPETYVLDAEREGGVPEPWHVWVTDGKKHYDAEVPSGVEDWSDLPFFERTLGV